MTSDRVEVVQRMIEAFRVGDLDAALATVHQKLVVHEAASLPYGGEWTGPDGFRDLLHHLGDHGLEVLASEIFDAGDEVVVRFDTRFTSPRSGAVIPMPIVEVYRFADGLISDIDIFYKDTKALIDL